MELCDRLPDLPPVPLRVVEDRSPGGEGFLRLVRQRLVIEREDGKTSAGFDYDQIDRNAIDAVVVAAYFWQQAADGRKEPWVVLRSALRPPVAQRSQERSPVQEPVSRHLWELPAGLIEPHEQSPAGVREAAQRELMEETGFDVRPEALLPLGASTFPCPGVIAERQFFFRVAVDPGSRATAPLDGSVLEAVGTVVAVRLSTALAAARAGGLTDAKTELGLRRLAEALE